MRKRRALTGEAGWSLRRSRILTTHGSADDQHQREIDGAAVLVFGAGGRRPGDVAPDLESVGRVVGDVARAHDVAALVTHLFFHVAPSNSRTASSFLRSARSLASRSSVAFACAASMSASEVPQRR